MSDDGAEEVMNDIYASFGLRNCGNERASSSRHDVGNIDSYETTHPGGVPSHTFISSTVAGASPSYNQVGPRHFSSRCLLINLVPALGIFVHMPGARMSSQNMRIADAGMSHRYSHAADQKSSGVMDIGQSGARPDPVARRIT
jgi:hypothetical protein